MANTQKNSDVEDAPSSSAEAGGSSSATDEPKEETTNTDSTSNDDKSSGEDKEPKESKEQKEKEEPKEGQQQEEEPKDSTVKETENNVEAAGTSSVDKSEDKVNEVEDAKADSAYSTSKSSTKEDNSSGDEALIDIEDPDDYLLYLESILVKIHTRFYAYYDETKQAS